MADSSIFTQEEKKKILNELRALEERNTKGTKNYSTMKLKRRKELMIL